LHQLAFPPAVYKDSFFSTSSPTPVVGGVFDDGYSNRQILKNKSMKIIIASMKKRIKS
jgi:hypothetical protein